MPLVRDYGDIAFSTDGATLYGVDFPGLGSTTLYTIAPTTGEETASVVITGPIADLSAQGGSSVNGLTAAADGRLIAGSFKTSQIFLIDPATGASSVAPYAFPDGFVSAGDFLTLADGDILAFASPEGQTGQPSAVFRIHPDNTVTRIGTLPQIYGAAQSGDQVYAFGSAGDIMRLDSVPTAESTGLLPVTVVEATGRAFWGATAQQDAGQCPDPSYTVQKSASTSGPVHAGDTVTYTVTVTNTGQIVTNAAFTDDLSGVLDDATLVPDSIEATTGTAELTGTALTWHGTLAAGDTATVTYRVKVDSPVSGNPTLGNTVTATAPGGSCASAGRCTVEVPVTSTEPKLKIRKDVEETAFTGPGEVLHYTFEVTNTGPVPVSDITVTDDGPGNPAVTCPVTTLQPGESTVCTATYTTTAADVRAGRISDIATVTGRGPDGTAVTATSNRITLVACPCSDDCSRVKHHKAKITSKGSLVIRKGPGTSHKEVGSLKPGSHTQVICKTGGEQVDGNTTWYRLADGRGWIPARYAEASPSVPVCG
ncbi:SH3 domain-containing protein [Streptomyces sp. XM83C]|uniref:DUF7507 domain-containing protein n=1 Tax=unclassified Streptomyces TaxID=2593676 RepID=UPI001FFA8398|nr:SH3 domain-containing protein [Streptomyces sp. XM83C]MCK1820926.1 SH3 domain-containing protein [Streptomyces sp. XM83C]